MLLTQIEVKGDESKLSAVSLSAVLSVSITRTVAFARSCGVVLIPAAVQRDFVRGDEYLLIRGFQALLETAVKFSERGETVQLFCDGVPDWRRVVIESTGKAIPASALTNFFELFSIGEEMTPAGDLGLRPPLASRILSLFGASVSVEKRASSGIRLTILLKEAALTRANSGTI